MDSVNSERRSFFFCLFTVSGATTFLRFAVFADDSSHKFHKFCPFHDYTAVVGLDDAYIFGDGCGSDHIVSSDHSDFDASLVTLFDGSWHFFPRNIPDSEDANEDEIILFYLKNSLLIFFVEVAVFGDVFVGKAKSS